MESYDYGNEAGVGGRGELLAWLILSKTLRMWRFFRQLMYA